MQGLTPVKGPLWVFKALPISKESVPEAAMALGQALGAVLALALAMLGPLSLGALAGDCKGQRQVLREAPGFVTDGAGNYSVNGNCEWLIEGEWGRVGHSLIR